MYARAPISTAEEVDAAFEAASRAFPAWRDAIPAQRQLAFRLADALAEGFMQSGYGKDLSVYGFEDYTRVKHVMSSLE